MFNYIQRGSLAHITAPSVPSSFTAHTAFTEGRYRRRRVSSEEGIVSGRDIVGVGRRRTKGMIQSVVIVERVFLSKCTSRSLRLSTSLITGGERLSSESVTAVKYQMGDIVGKISGGLAEGGYQWSWRRDEDENRYARAFFATFPVPRLCYSSLEHSPYASLTHCTKRHSEGGYRCWSREDIIGGYRRTGFSGWSGGLFLGLDGLAWGRSPYVQFLHLNVISAPPLSRLAIAGPSTS